LEEAHEEASHLIQSAPQAGAKKAQKNKAKQNKAKQKNNSPQW